MAKRKRYSAEFKAKVALDALRGEETMALLPTMRNRFFVVSCGIGTSPSFGRSPLKDNRLIWLI